VPRNVSTLKDKVARSQQLGLAQQSVQQLAGEAGRPSAPTTAVETGVLGGTPQQQAMAGTPAQKKAVVAAPTGETQLEQAQTLTAEPVTTAEEEAKKTQAKQLATSLGTFGAKVSEWVNSAKQKITGTKAEIKVDATDKLLGGLPAAKKTDAMDLIKKIAIASNTPGGTVQFGNKTLSVMEAEQQLNVILGRDASTVLSPEEKREMYADVATSMSAAVEAGQTAALGADRKITLQDLTTLGTTPSEVAGLLGIPEADIGNYTITQLQQKIQEVSSQQFNVAQQAQAGLSSGALSSADRAALRQYLRNVEQAGIAGAEAAVAGLAQDIDRGRTVTFGGKQYTVEELLESTALNDLVKQFLADPKSPIAVELTKTEPDFVKWITDNKQGIETLVSKSGETTTAYGGIQKANVETLGIIAKEQPELAKKLGYDPKQLRTGKLEAKDLPGAFQSIAALEPGEQQAAAANLSLVEKAAPGQVAGLTKEQVDNLDLTNPQGVGAKYVTAVTDQKRADKLRDPQEIADEYLSADMSIEDIDAALTDSALAEALGLPSGSIGELDVNKDGVFDKTDAKALKGKITSSIPSLAEVADGADVTTTRNSFKVTPPRLRGDAGSLYSLVSDKILHGEPVTAEDIRPGFGEKTEEELNNLVSTIPDVKSPPSSPQAASASQQVKGALAQLIDEKVKARQAAEAEAAARAAEEAAAAQAKAQQEEQAAIKYVDDRAKKEAQYTDDKGNLFKYGDRIGTQQLGKTYLLKYNSETHQWEKATSRDKV